MTKGIISHFQMALYKDANQLLPEGQSCEKNKMETLGTWLGYPIIQLPADLYHCFSNPKVAVVSVTAITMIGIQFAFYPNLSKQYVEKALRHIQEYIKPEHIRFAGWLVCEITALGLGLRAYGRFSNTILMQKWNSA